jgi:hypothetical protein
LAAATIVCSNVIVERLTGTGEPAAVLSEAAPERLQLD